jgi:hypothetical protein
MSPVDFGRLWQRGGNGTRVYRAWWARNRLGLIEKEVTFLGTDVV